MKYKFHTSIQLAKHLLFVLFKRRLTRGAEFFEARCMRLYSRLEVNGSLLYFG